MLIVEKLKLIRRAGDEVLGIKAPEATGGIGRLAGDPTLADSEERRTRMWVTQRGFQKNAVVRSGRQQMLDRARLPGLRLTASGPSGGEHCGSEEIATGSHCGYSIARDLCGGSSDSHLDCLRCSMLASKHPVLHDRGLNVFHRGTKMPTREPKN